MREPPRTSILIVNWNGGALLRNCLDSVARQTLPPHEVIVVDNGSSDRSWDLPHVQANPACRLIRLERNCGFSMANNLAFAESTGDWIVLLNNDVELAPDWLEKMLAASESPGVGSVAGQLRQLDHPELMDCAGFELCFNGSTQAAYGERAEDFPHEGHDPFGVVASAAMYRRSALEELGVLFHEQYFAYYEDTDLAMRLRLFGYETAYAPGALAWHAGSATGKRRSAFQCYHLRRNIEYVFWVNFSPGYLLRAAPLHLFTETLAFFDMLVRGMGLEFIRAKTDALKNIRWMLQTRRKLFSRIPRENSARMESRVIGFRAYLKHKHTGADRGAVLKPVRSGG